ncbi:ABC transporter permease [Priestia abyssalis]|uniref:ABC transporter permease n=1 Tax=Priestia abyssalis TaxID=1221450 RepID=UPI0009959926|nr:ABC transporter permease [Priestia abyssalis]
MNNLFSLVQNENMKIFLRTRTLFLIGLIVLINFLTAIFMKNVLQQAASLSTMWDFTLSSVNLLWVVQVFAVIIAGDIVASEFSWGTIKLLLIRPATRAKILFSKYIAVLFFTWTIMFVLFFSSLLFGLIFFGPGGGGLFMFGKVTSTYCLQFIEILMMVTFAFMISTVFRSSSLSIGLAIFLTFMGKPIVDILYHFNFEWGKYVLFANTDLTPYFSGGDPLFSGMSLGFSILMLLIYFTLFQTLSWLVFMKRDVSV